MLIRYTCGLLAALLALVATGCAPTYLLAMQPAAPHTLFASGQPAAEATADSVVLHIKFLGYEPDYLVFDAEYRNDSPRPVEIRPTAFAYAPVRAAGVRPACGRPPSACSAASGCPPL